MSSTDQKQTDGWAKDFSYDYFRKLLRTLQANFDLRTLSEYRSCRSTDERVAFVRHDVDVCLERAVEMAEVEHELGVRSTYMVIPDTPLYDIEAEQDLLYLIREFGHEIALHCDLDPMSKEDADMAADNGLSPAELRQVEDAKRRLEKISIQPVKSLSFHQPSERVLGGPQTIAGMVNAYNPDLLSTYISDSSGRWREGNPIETITGDITSILLQVLTHPVWWGQYHLPPLERFISITNTLEVLDERVHDELVSICSAYDDRVTMQR